LKTLETRDGWGSRLRKVLGIPRWLSAGLAGTAFAMANQEEFEGMRFFLFGQGVGLRSLMRGRYGRFKAYFLSPLVLFRFPEFGFAYRVVPWGGKRVLDVSSPSLFSAFLHARHDDVRISMFNPDRRDIEDTKSLYTDLGVSDRVEFLEGFPSEGGRYDCVVSISVIEHVVEEEVGEFLRGIWRVLEDGGQLVLSFPVARTYREEYRADNTYGLDVPQDDEGRFFYQRVHDEQSIDETIVSVWEALGGSM
jgi:SAM-dependent methyltransferase